MNGATPRTLPLAAVAQLIGGSEPPQAAAHVTGATHHSGRVRAGDLFFALPGAHGHGIEFADQALEAGAVAVVSDRPHPHGVQVPDPAAALLRLGRWCRARLRGPLVAVTGSAGKTTAKALIRAAIDADASEGNLNTEHALAGRLVRAWSQGRARPLVLELGIDHVGEMARLVQLVRPDVGVLTVLGAAHLDGLIDRDTVAREKAELLYAAPRAFAAEAAWQRLPTRLAERTVRYGLDAPEADVHGLLQGDPFHPALRVLAPEARTVPLPALGRGAAESALGALAVADALGVKSADAAERLAHAELEPGRLTVRRCGAMIVLDDAYNANPSSLPDALALLRAGPSPHRALLGDMRELGPESRARHREMGEAVRDLDAVVFCGGEGDALQEGHPGAMIMAEAEVAAWLDALPRDGTLLVKASRSLRFERFVQRIVNGEEPA